MLKRIARWILRVEINNLEHDCWIDGVNQQRYEPESATHGLKSHSMYWHGFAGECKCSPIETCDECLWKYQSGEEE